MMDKWGLLLGPWGDVICMMGLCQKYGCKKLAYYLGASDSMSEFIRCQQWVEEYVNIHKKTTLAERSRVAGLLMHGETFHNGIERALAGTELHPKEFMPTTAVYSGGMKRGDIPIVHGLNLPDHCRHWAADMALELGEFYMIQPYSINTVKAEGHWPYWKELIQWICADESKKFLLCGTNWDASEFGGSDNVIDLVGRTPTVCHMYAIAEHAKGVITTSNSLAHFCVAQEIPATVVMNTMSSEPSFFFNQAIGGESIQTYTYYSKVLKVAYSLNERWGIWPSKGE